MHSKSRNYLLSAAVAVLCIASSPQIGHAAQTYEYDFTNGNLNPNIGPGTLTYAGTTASSTSFGTSNGTTVPNINGTPTQYMNVPKMTTLTNGYDLTFTNSGANGGGSYINQYTFAFDLLAPSLPGNGYLALLNTNNTNATGNDADFYIKATGSAADVGITGGTYSSGGALTLNAWHRVVITADLSSATAANNSIKLFVDGVRVVNATGYSRDGTFALFSNANAGSDVRLFNEGYDSAGAYTNQFYLSAVAFTDSTLTDTQVGSLGGPQAAGIFVVPEPSSTALLGGILIAFELLRRWGCATRRNIS